MKAREQKSQDYPKGNQPKAFVAIKRSENWVKLNQELMESVLKKRKLTNSLKESNL